MDSEKNQIEICLENPIAFGLNDSNGVRVISLKYHNIKRPVKGFNMLKAAFIKSSLILFFDTINKSIVFENEKRQKIASINTNFDMSYLKEIVHNHIPLFFTIYDNSNIDENSIDRIPVSSCIIE